uniref:Uncharacterized protein n=1 Tax=Cacopsylla melanoneura TaxID=428564 RepID=A0A8D8V5X4_9HEMI
MLIRCFLLCSLLLYETSGRLKNPHPKDFEFEHKVHDLLDEGLEPTEIHILPDLRFNKYLDAIHCKGRFRPESFQIIVISRIFTNRTVLERHAMVHEALRDEMMKREAGCAIDIHADTPEEWNEFKAANDFDEVSGKPDLRMRAAKTTPINLKDQKLRDKIYNYLKMHFKPTILHVVDSKKMHPVENDNPAFDVLLVSLHFSNLTITQRTMMMHDYLRDFINEGIQFRLHLDPPEEYQSKNVDLYLGDYTLEPTERDRSI